MAAGALLAGVGCGNDGDVGGSTRGGFPALSGAEVIEATRGARTAKGTIDHHESTADPPGDHGLSGYREQDLHIEVELDFEQDRSLVRWESPVDEIAEMLGEDVDSPPMRVEARTIDGITYVRDGSWLCPLCGLDADDPPRLPSDKWITVPVQSDDVAFDFDSMNAFAGLLGWIELVEGPVEPQETRDLNGASVGVYETRWPSGTFSHGCLLTAQDQSCRATRSPSRSWRTRVGGSAGSRSRSAWTIAIRPSLRYSATSAHPSRLTSRPRARSTANRSDRLNFPPDSIRSISRGMPSRSERPLVPHVPILAQFGPLSTT